MALRLQGEWPSDTLIGPSPNGLCSSSYACLLFDSCAVHHSTAHSTFPEPDVSVPTNLLTSPCRSPITSQSKEICAGTMSSQSANMQISMQAHLWRVVFTATGLSAPQAIMSSSCNRHSQTLHREHHTIDTWSSVGDISDVFAHKGLDRDLTPSCSTNPKARKHVVQPYSISARGMGDTNAEPWQRETLMRSALLNSDSTSCAFS